MMRQAWIERRDYLNRWMRERPTEATKDAAVSTTFAGGV